MSKIPRTFCVSLRELPIRSKIFLEGARKEGIEAEIFDGVFGKRMGLTPKLPNELECPGQNIFMSDGAVGCYLSHYILWHMLQYQPEDEFFIVEDDAIFTDKFEEKFLERYDKLPRDWEMIYVGWIPYGKDDSPAIVDKGISIRIPSATHAYLVKKSALPKLCQNLQPCQSPLDLAIIKNVLPLLKYYVFDPPLVYQRSFGNTKDPVWVSLVYSWQHDLYGYRKRMLRELSLGEGWHTLERDNQRKWRWSQNRFDIQLPTCAEKILLTFSTPVENNLNVKSSQGTTNYKLLVGENKISIDTKEEKSLKFSLDTPFIPSKFDKNSSDNRVLGICLTEFSVIIGSIPISIEMSDL